MRERAFEPPATCFLTGVWRATVLLGPTPAAINPLMALCPYAFQPLLAILVLSPFSPFALSLSLTLSLSALCCTALRHPTTFIPTRMTSVTILLYFPSNPRHPFLFSLTVSSYIFSLSLAFSFPSGLILLLFPPDGLFTLSFSQPPLPLIRRLTLSFILAELHYDTFSSRELFHPPRRDHQPSRSDAFDHSRGYPIVRRVSAFSRFYGTHTHTLSRSQFPSFASSTVYLCLTECNPFLPRNHHRHGPTLSAGAPATIQNCG